MRQRIKFIVYAGVLAALYVALTYAQNLLWPGSTSMAVQFRLSEALCVFAFFTPAAIPGLTIGCLLYNISYAQALPLDFLVGSLATLGAAACMRGLRKVKVRKLPVLGLLMPAVWNAPLVGWELAVFITDSGFAWPAFFYNAATVFLGEAAVLLVLGSLLYLAFAARGMDRKLFPESCG